MVFCDSRVLVRKLASAFGHPTQVSTQVQLAPTCDFLPVRLTRAMMTCRHVDARPGIVSSLPKRAQKDWNGLFRRKKYLKLDWAVKMSLHWLIMGVAGS